MPYSQEIVFSLLYYVVGGYRHKVGIGTLPEGGNRSYAEMHAFYEYRGIVDSKKQFTSSAFSMYALADLEGLSSGSVVLTTIYAISRKELRSCGVKLAFALF